MVVFPQCKINLGLHVVSKRDDGFHNIETCFYPVPWTDILEVIKHFVTKEVKWERTFSKANEIKL